MSHRPRTHRDTALVVLATAGGAAWMAVPLGIVMDDGGDAAIAAMIAGCALGALIAVTTARMSALAAGMAGVIAALLLQGSRSAWSTHDFTLGAAHLGIAALAGAAAEAGASLGRRWRVEPQHTVTAALVSLGVVVLFWTAALMTWELARPLADWIHITLTVVLLSGPFLGGVACALVIPGSHPGHVAMSWLVVIVSATFAVAIAARTPLAIGPGLLIVLIVAPFLSGLGAFGAHLASRRRYQPSSDLPEARAL